MNPAKVWGVVLLTCVIGCGGGGDNGDAGTGPGTGTGTGNNPPGSTTNAISVRDNSFDPNATTVTPGTTVTWTWRGSTTHDVTFDDGAESNRQSTGTYARTFPTAGTYGYHCSIHGYSMSGDVVVK